MKKRIAIIIVLGVLASSFMTACGSKGTKNDLSKEQATIEKDTETIHTKGATKAPKTNAMEEDTMIAETSQQMTEDTESRKEIETETSKQVLNDNSINVSFSDWEEAYKDVLLNPQKYKVSLMDSTTPDDGWENLGFTIIDLDGDSTPELLAYYNDGSEASAADVLAYTNGTIQNIANVWTEGAFKAEKSSFVTMDNGGLYGSSFYHRYAKNEQGIYEQIKSFDHINDEGSEQNIYKEDEQKISKDQFNADLTANDMDYSNQCIEASGMYHVLDDGLSKDTSKEKMDEFWTK